MHRGASEPPPHAAFACSVCGFSVPEAEHGRRPSFNASIVFLEDAYYMRDPLAGDTARPVVLGGACAACERLVCASPRCSLFYAKRICTDCLQRPEIRAQLPQEVLPPPAPRGAPS